MLMRAKAMAVLTRSPISLHLPFAIPHVREYIQEKDLGLMSKREKFW